MADQTLLSTIAPVSIIFSLFLGKYMLKESIYKKHFYSCGFMIAGAMLALVFAYAWMILKKEIKFKDGSIV